MAETAEGTSTRGARRRPRCPPDVDERRRGRDPGAEVGQRARRHGGWADRHAAGARRRGRLELAGERSARRRGAGPAAAHRRVVACWRRRAGACAVRWPPTSPLPEPGASRGWAARWPPTTWRCDRWSTAWSCRAAGLRARLDGQRLLIDEFMLHGAGGAAGGGTRRRHGGRRLDRRRAASPGLGAAHATARQHPVGSPAHRLRPRRGQHRRGRHRTHRQPEGRSGPHRVAGRDRAAPGRRRGRARARRAARPRRRRAPRSRPRPRAASG